MKILFITEDHSINNYGITTVVSQLADELTSYQPDIELFIYTPGMEAVPQNQKVKIKLGKQKPFFKSWGWNPKIFTQLEQIVREEHIELIHIHGIWMASQWAALYIAKENHLPCVVSAHGMLEPWLWNNQGILQKIKKLIYFNCFFRPAIGSNVTFHSITPFEQQHYNEQVPGFKTVVIPNATIVPLKGKLQNQTFDHSFLFLGRIHPKKGVDLLIEAFSKAKLDSEWHLYIVGPDSVPVYTQQLKKLVFTLGIQDQVIFTGALFQNDKEKIIQNAWAMVTPSYSEVVGMVNLEAAMQYVPSITTFETGLWDWEEGGGILVHPDVEQLTAALKNAANWSKEERLERGQRSFNFVAHKYSWQAVLPKWVDFYTSLVENRKS